MLFCFVSCNRLVRSPETLKVEIEWKLGNPNKRQYELSYRTHNPDKKNSYLQKLQI
jgi:hypothetical protein